MRKILAGTSLMAAASTAMAQTTTTTDLLSGSGLLVGLVVLGLLFWFFFRGN